VAEYLWVFCHVGFFMRSRGHGMAAPTKDILMDEVPLTMAQRLAEVASAMQQQRTGHQPTAVTVVLGEDTLVVTLHDALSPAEKALARSPEGAARVQEFHRQLFANSSDAFRKEIKRLTGRDVREAVAEIEPSTGAVVHAFTTGTMVHIFHLVAGKPPDATTHTDATEIDERADDDGMRVASEDDIHDGSTPLTGL
jgi:uncharacterized protein YbcI